MIELNDSNFDATVAKTPKVLVDFYADWCGPCKTLSPVVEELSRKYEGKVLFGKVNVDKSPRSSSRYEIMSIPTLILFSGGMPMNGAIGVIPKDQIERMIEGL